LSKDDIEKMIEEAERFKAEDEMVRQTVEARNGLESYVYSMKNTINDEKFQGKIAPEEKTEIESALKTCSDWLDDNRDATKDQYAEQQKYVEGVCNPIVSRLYQDGQAPQGAAPEFGAAPDFGQGSSEPKIEELD